MYEFDDFNRMSAMYTLRDTSISLASFADFCSNISSFDKTAWLYDLATGLLTNKLYADGKGPTYTYTADGKLATRAWARGITTEYSYAPCCGALTNISYSDGTPSVSFTLDRLGRQVSITDGQGTRNFSYNDQLQLAAETNALGTIERSYDSIGRNTGFTLGSDYSVKYWYSGDGRFSSLSSIAYGQSNGWAYSYVPNSELLSGCTEAGSGASVSRSYETHRDLLACVSNGVGATYISAFNYQNDVLGRRTQRIDSGSAVVTNEFGYNPRSELTNAMMGTSSFAWDLDNIGNRKISTANGEPKNYTANTLNQYTQITNGGLRNLSYDLDGDLTNDSVFVYSFNGENRLICAEPVSPTSGAQRVRNSYDYQGRRWMKAVDTWGGAEWVPSSTNLFQYDGYNLVSELCSSDTPSLFRTNFYVRGLDLSGSLQGAGGIGGLLALCSGTNSSFYFADANGNITELTDSSGTVTAHYEWDAYGNRLNAPAGNEPENPYLFSSQYFDRETGLYMYIFRPYAPSLERWISRDPASIGWGNDYMFLLNDCYNVIDSFGLTATSVNDMYSKVANNFPAGSDFSFELWMCILARETWSGGGFHNDKVSSTGAKGYSQITGGSGSYAFNRIKQYTTWKGWLDNPASAPQFFAGWWAAHPASSSSGNRPIRY